MTIPNEIKQNIIILLKQCEFRKLCDTYFDENFLWAIKGTSILSGTYHNKEQFFEKVIGRLSKVLLSTDWKMHALLNFTRWGIQRGESRFSPLVASANLLRA